MGREGKRESKDMWEENERQRENERGGGGFEKTER